MSETSYLHLTHSTYNIPLLRVSKRGVEGTTLPYTVRHSLLKYRVNNHTVGVEGKKGVIGGDFYVHGFRKVSSGFVNDPLDYYRGFMARLKSMDVGHRHVERTGAVSTPN